MVNGEPIANAEIEQIWRNTIGGGVIWDAPVYGQFFRNMRAINWMLPPERRVRVVLGDPPIDFAKIKSASDAAAVPTEDSRDTFYAGVVASEVLAKGRRGLLVAGYPHLRHGLHPTRSANQLNAVTLLDQQHPKSVFTIETLPVNPGWMPDDAIQQIVTEFVAWTAPSVAKIAGTWLGQVAASVRAVDPNATLEAQVDAVLWLGPNTRLTASRADPAVYQCGDYATELARRSTVLNEIQGSQGRPVDMVADGLLAARAPANWP